MRSRAFILDACADLIAEEGFAGVTIEAVAARSGAAKTTVYRHWPSREALLIEAFGICSGPPGPPPDSGRVRDDLRVVLGGLVMKLRDADWCASMASLLDAASRDPGIASLHAATMSERRRPLLDVLERARARGELPADSDLERTASLLAGPLFYRALVSREPIDDRMVEAVIDAALPAPGPEAGGR